MMNCFHWQNLSTDYLDGLLDEATRKAADRHLKSCRSCNERNHHYRLILSTLSEQPKATLPVTLKKFPLLSIWQRFEALRMNLSSWERIPWYLRTLMEGVGIILLVLAGISAAPKIRSFYEKRLESNLTALNEGMSVSEMSEDKTTGDIPPLQGAASGVTPDSPRDEIAGEDDHEETASEVGVHVRAAPLWRFTLKTVSPEEMRPQVMNVLKELNIAPSTPGFGGVRVPGGIEFDLVVPQAIVPELKAALEKLSPEPKHLFSWYRVKSKIKTPDGTSKVIIWLAQPN